ncbi:hypothetical protein MAM1_0024d02009 [Mucor ambiguus]|uniref:Uncharacterized protein n=1 Tax=Mucor ambiguus TaxID=91626 RepID=A0A0C9LS58_9FUNG|nr:hypothetical protein MAM1_0024d02009 [Mucor ambiguus]
MTMPNPMYTASSMYASPAMPQMASATPYYNGPSPYTPVMAAQQTPGYYPPMGAMQVGGGPVMAQQPYPVVYQRHGCCCDCCYGDYLLLCVYVAAVAVMKLMNVADAS